MPARRAAPIIFIRCGCGPPNEHYLKITFIKQKDVLSLPWWRKQSGLNILVLRGIFWLGSGVSIYVCSCWINPMTTFPVVIPAIRGMRKRPWH